MTDKIMPKRGAKTPLKAKSKPYEKDGNWITEEVLPNGSIKRTISKVKPGEEK